VNWDLNEKDAENIEEAIRLGLEEASVRGREIARMAYLNFKELFPKRSEKMKAQLPAPLRTKLNKAEAEYTANSSANTSNLAENLSSTSPAKDSINANGKCER
jgi:DNA invertase Pin-like site-specific DNA recombinase